MKRIINWLLLLGVMLLMAGCSFFETNTTLITPPQLPSDKDEIKQAITKSLPDHVELVAPVHSEESNANILIDLDNDGKEEAVVFYKTQHPSDPVRGMVFKNDHGWKKISDIRGEGTILVDLDFADLNQDGKKEILAGFAYAEDSEDYGMLVYDVFSEAPSNVLLDKPYTTFLVDSFDTSNEDQLVLIKLNRGQRNTVSLYNYESESLVQVDDLELDPYINGYYHMESGRISKNKTGMMLDAGIGAHAAMTFVIHVAEGHMEDIFEVTEENPTLKPSSVNSEDSNEDGILEFGVLEEPYMEEPLPYVDTPYITVHYQLSDKWKPKAVTKGFYNYDYSYKIDIPTDWPRLEIDQSEDRTHVELKPAGTDVVFFDVLVTNKEKPSGDWQLLAKHGDYRYFSSTVDKDKKHLFQLINSLDEVN
ncbi:VCBS repeat-containing protein [Ornithinibacillus gellani]|uniref:FG-GAP repeat domain-containing protein n=1 Tax=Ornithinibacillus gellani TaxID=2293253 RepID=UPI000F4A9570|nr:VCBS repeat-containing protein [Ornithinibacillus gellani]TQS75395.1 VCBS repeat-containing protein [Ornithinibacillus gellani]